MSIRRPNSRCDPAGRNADDEGAGDRVAGEDRAPGARDRERGTTELARPPGHAEDDALPWTVGRARAGDRAERQSGRGEGGERCGDRDRPGEAVRRHLR